MLFKKKHVKLILEDRKTATRRLTGRYKLGRVYAIQGWLYDKARGYILIVKKYRQRLGDMSEEDVRKEGYSVERNSSVSGRSLTALALTMGL